MIKGKEGEAHFLHLFFSQSNQYSSLDFLSIPES